MKHQRKHSGPRKNSDQKNEQKTVYNLNSKVYDSNPLFVIMSWWSLAYTTFTVMVKSLSDSEGIYSFLSMYLSFHVLLTYLTREQRAKAQSIAASTITEETFTDDKQINRSYQLNAVTGKFIFSNNPLYIWPVWALCMLLKWKHSPFLLNVNTESLNLLTFLMCTGQDVFWMGKNWRFNRSYPLFLQGIKNYFQKNLNIHIHIGKIIGKYAELIFKPEEYLSIHRLRFNRDVFYQILEQTCLRHHLGYVRISWQAMMVLYESNFKFTAPIKIDENNPVPKNTFFDDLLESVWIEAQTGKALSTCTQLLCDLKNPAGGLFFGKLKFEKVKCLDEKTDRMRASLIVDITHLGNKKALLLKIMNELTQTSTHIIPHDQKIQLVISIKNVSSWNLNLQAAKNIFTQSTQTVSQSGAPENQSNLTSYPATFMRRSEEQKPVPLKKSRLKELADLANATVDLLTTKVIELKPVRWHNNAVYNPDQKDSLIQHWEHNRYIWWDVDMENTPLSAQQYCHYQRLALVEQTRNIRYIGSVEGIAVYKLRQGHTDLRVWGCVVSEPGEPLLIRFFQVAAHKETRQSVIGAFMLNLVREAGRDPLSLIDNKPKSAFTLNLAPG